MTKSGAAASTYIYITQPQLSHHDANTEIQKYKYTNTEIQIRGTVRLHLDHSSRPFTNCCHNPPDLVQYFDLSKLRQHSLSRSKSKKRTGGEGSVENN